LFLAAAIQMTSGPDRESNEKRALELVDEACSRGAKLVGLPEVWEHVGPAAQKRAFAGPVEGRQLARLRDLCAKRSVWCVAGSISEQRDAAGSVPPPPGGARTVQQGRPEPRLFNTSALIGPGGELAAVYRKLHLFDVDIPDGAHYRESDTIAPGREPPPVAELHGLGVRIGLSVCYDLRFPELYRKMADSGADILSVPAAFTAYTGRAHWEVLLRARAVENQAYAFAPAQVGRIGPPAENRVAYGHAMIVDPWGDVVADAGGTGESMALAAIDSARIAQVRRDLPALAHRRRDVL
jgi:predicted amidohydrolase